MLSSCGREYLHLLSFLRSSYSEVQHGDFLVGVQPYVFHCFRHSRSNARGYRVASDSCSYLLVHHDFLGGASKATTAGTRCSSHLETRFGNDYPGHRLCML